MTALSATVLCSRLAGELNQADVLMMYLLV
jgi:hypothetical protein